MDAFPLRLRHPSGTMMELERDRVLVELREPRTAAAAGDVLGALGLVLEPEGDPQADGRGRVAERVNHTETRKWARTADGSAFRPTAVQEARERRTRQQLAWVAPVYRLYMAGRPELLAPLPHALLVRVADPQREKEVLERVRKLGLTEDTVRSRYLGAYRYFLVADPLERPAYELRDQLADDPALACELELMPMFVPTAYVPNDPLFVSQWDMERIRAGGAGQTAWNLQRGQAAIVICILDAGCDLNHPDLSYAGQGLNLGTMQPTGAPTGNHGTPCAGIAAATIDNSAGVAGVAGGGCRILPVAFSAWTDVEVAAGIIWATDNGARVISMSFGWNPWNPAIIDPAIQYAFDHNVVMCVATHNHNTANGITYPATNPLVIACGASDQLDNRKSPASPDGENWGSNFGPQMSVVAPGVLCPSTDRLGGNGYTGGDYVMTFNGTSAATPHVAGLAGLLLSCEPGLSNVEIRDIIEQTADKVGTVAYAVTPGYTNGTWNNQMGYGRINALQAVKRVCKTLIFEFKPIIDKPFVFDHVHKLERFKEKERIDEVKGLIGYENPDYFNRVIFDHILERLDRLEQRPDMGQPFIPRELRPRVGQNIVAAPPPAPGPAPAPAPPQEAAPRRRGRGKRR